MCVGAGFRYDANCPRYFVDDLELCAIKHVYSQQRDVLDFRSDNDLVAATTDPRTISDACRCVLVSVCPNWSCVPSNTCTVSAAC